MHDNVCFVDTETTGLDPVLHEIWEVGLITPDGQEHEWQLPVDLALADPMALSIGRFHERRKGPPGLPPPEPYRKQVEKWDFAQEFADLTRGMHLAGAVVSFDAERLWKLLRAKGQCPMWHYHLIDVEALAAGWLAATGSTRVTIAGESVGLVDGRPPWRSEDLSRAVGVDPDDFARHTALGDAAWAKAIYEAVMPTSPTPVVEANLTCSAVHWHSELGGQYCSRDEGHLGWHESNAMAWNDLGHTSIRFPAWPGYPDDAQAICGETRDGLTCAREKGHSGMHQVSATENYGPAWGGDPPPCDDRVGEFLCCLGQGHAGLHRSPFKAEGPQLEWRPLPDEEPF